MQKIFAWIKTHEIMIKLGLTLATLLAFVAIAFWRSGELVERQKEKPAALTQEQTQDAKALQQQLDVSRKNADALLLAAR